MFKNVGHFFTAVAKGIVHAGRAVAKVAPEIEKAKPIVEGVTALIFPPAVRIEELAFQLFGNASHAVSDAGDAVDAKGVNLQLDLALVQEIKAMITEMEKFAEAFHMQKPAQPAAAAAVAGV